MKLGSSVKRVRLISLLFVALTTTAAAAADASFVVIVNATNASTPGRGEIAAMFMKRLTAWPDGSAVVPVDQVNDAPVRAGFSRAVIRKDVDLVEAYWQQQIFSGRGIPPVVKKSDAEVIAFVRDHPRAIGYVSATAVTGAVRVISWK